MTSMKFDYKGVTLWLDEKSQRWGAYLGETGISASFSTPQAAYSTLRKLRP